jgi:hypothetical protein
MSLLLLILCHWYWASVNSYAFIIRNGTFSSLDRGCDPDSFLPGLQVPLHCVRGQLHIRMETVEGDHTGTCRLHG